MRRILGIVWRNFGQRARTLAPTDMPPRSAPFRGLIEQDASRCTGCRACAYVCAPRAISFTADGESGVDWNFFAGQCSFCGLCVQFCPTHAITNNGRLPPVGGDQAALRVTHRINYRACTGCGCAILPIPDAPFAELLGAAPTEEETALQAMCPDCRRRAASRHIHDAFLSGEGKHGRH